MSNDNNLRTRLHHVIPGGCHTYSRGDDQFSSNTPALFKSGKGAYLYTNDDKKFLDYGMGLRSVNIGYGDEEIAKAAYKEILNGNNLTRASYIELIAAETLADLIPSVEMVKFAKHGSTVTSAAIKLARAFTGKKYILAPIEQPFFSFDDWFIGTTQIKKGTLDETSKYTLRFPYNDIDALSILIDECKNDVAAIIMEGATHLTPCSSECSKFATCNECPRTRNNYLRQVQKLCNKKGIVFILDEMITGFRWNLRGAQEFYGVTPDLSTFGKAMANGFSLSALAGKREIMELGNIINLGQERVFLTSTTHGAEMCSLGAFLKTLEIMKNKDVINHIWNFGNILKSGLTEITNEFKLNDFIEISGYPCSPQINFLDSQKNSNFPLRTLFMQEMLENEILIPYIAISYSHNNLELEKTLDAFRKIAPLLLKGIEVGEYKLVRGQVIKPVFRKFN